VGCKTSEKFLICHKGELFGNRGDKACCKKSRGEWGDRPRKTYKLFSAWFCTIRKTTLLI